MAFSIRLLVFVLMAAPLFALPPAIDEPALSNGAPSAFPVGKTLTFPLTAADPENQPLTYTVSSSNPKILVRAKTGNPALRLSVAYNGDQPFTGDLVFQLFRDWTPITAGFIGGFAQAGFYDGVKFHRVIPTFVLQGGDPLGTGQGGPGMTGNDPDTAFRFENEFHSGLIFTGRGQLAMANSGINRNGFVNDGGQVVLADFTASNGSQFFVTLEQLRATTPVHQANLDFKHTIFGQLLRGFDLVDQIAAVPLTSSTPTSDVVITSARTEPNNHDAVLVLSAKGAGSSIITVMVTDSDGETDRKQFSVSAVADEANSPPFLEAVAPLVTPEETQLRFGVRAIDLELDYLAIQRDVANTSRNYLLLGSSANGVTAASGRQIAVLGKKGYEGPLFLGVDVAQFSVATGKFEPVISAIPVTVSVGDKAARPEPVALEGSPGAPMTNAVVARLSDLDPAGAPTDFSVKINWGDGTPVTTGTIARDFSEPAAGRYSIVGTHTYSRPGIYGIVVEAVGNKGARATIRSTAVITAGAIRAVGQQLEVKGPRVANRVLATFSSADPAAQPGQFTATIDWGDGVNSPGLVARGGDGSFVVRGSHGYKDPEAFAICVRIHKSGEEPANDTFAWSRATISGFAAVAHLPPFPQAHLVAAWNSGPTKTMKNVVQGEFAPGELEVEFSGTFAIVNAGNRASRPGRLRFWLSDDANVDAGVDTRLRIRGALELQISALVAGGGGQEDFTLKLSKGESGGGKYLLSELVYSDPIADFEKVGKVVVTPVAPSILIFDRSGSMTSEAGGTVTFKVALDTAPTASVTIAVASSNTAEGTAAPAQLVFTPDDWSAAHVVTVTGVDDAIKDGSKSYQITLQTAVSADPIYSGLGARTVSLTNADNEP